LLDLQRIADLVQRFLSAIHDSRKVFEDAGARYFGAELHDDTLVPDANARLGALTFDAWTCRVALEAVGAELVFVSSPMVSVQFVACDRANCTQKRKRPLSFIFGR
jgi:hypothetical protein